MTITLPLPHKRLSPNYRCHWRPKHRLTKAARTRARLITLATIGPAPTPFVSTYTLAFYWPTLRRRDDDNASASCKAYRDGIADALGIDDHTIRQAGPPAMLLDRRNPRLEITLLP